MEGDQERVLAECSELTARVEKLAEFIESPACAAVPVVEQELLAQQLGVMQQYLAILETRIKAFPTT